MSTSMSFQNDKAIIDIVVKTMSSRSKIDSVDGVIKIYINSPPVDG